MILACVALGAMVVASCSALPFLHNYRGYYVNRIILDPPQPAPGQLVRITVTQVDDRDPNGIYPADVTLPDVAVSAGELFKVEAGSYIPGHEVPPGWGNFDSATLAANKDRYAELAPFSDGQMAGYVDSSGAMDYLIWRAPDTAQQVTIMAGYFWDSTEPSTPGKNGFALTVDVQ
jgi:hypothetical protein